MGGKSQKRETIGEEKIEEKERSLKEKLEDAEENAGDIEVKNAKLEHAELYAQIGDQEKALQAYDETYI